MSALLIAFIAVLADASCGSSSCPIDGNALQDAGRLSLDLSFQFIDQNQPRIGTRGAHIGEIASDHGEIRTVNRLTTLQLSYAPSTSLQFALTLPYVARFHEHRETATQQIERWNFHDFGDAALQARTRLFIGDGAAHPSLWLTAGVKLPTGVRHEPSDNGEDAEVTITPGTGSTDLLVGLAYQSGFLRDTSLAGPMGHTTLIPWFVAGNVRINGRGREQYRRGNEIQINAGSEYPLRTSLHLLGQVNARITAKDDVGNSGEERDLTGGRYLYFSPGAGLLLGQGASAYAFVQVPVYQRVNGLQLTAKVNYVVGIRQQF